MGIRYVSQPQHSSVHCLIVSIGSYDLSSFDERLLQAKGGKMSYYKIKFKCSPTQSFCICLLKCFSVYCINPPPTFGEHRQSWYLTLGLKKSQKFRNQVYGFWCNLLSPYLVQPGQALLDGNHQCYQPTRHWPHLP